MENLKIAIQKSGRLSEKSIELIGEAGINISNGARTLVAQSQNFPIDVLYLRDDDIPQYVADSVADIGIVGENVILEKKIKVHTVKKLGFGRCRLSLAIPKSEKYQDAHYFEGKKIATSYPNILKKYLKENNISAEIHVISGSVEIAPGIGLADGIFDIVSSGSTLISNGLKEVEVVLKSEAVIISSAANLSPSKQKILNDLLFRIEAVQKAKNNKYILLNAPNDKLNEIIEVLPGMKSPTVMPLAMSGWSSVHSVIGEDQFWEVIGQLKAKGAQGILVIPIEKMIV
ncbi:MAG: ATP phosphoribosyltransferase [Bacteroidota bacterium]|nr:ATP phosphoribosyltransferase [Bacteroidota bacterium]MDP4226613.1 ATP phosphoribosyltransferase [Bacteroidota bacterium]MDP4275231.1 ATP phosphoribosyltransferase [Bacteroidota bacterium]